MPLDDLPIHFPNTIVEPNETIVIPADSAAQWDMLRWAKSRGGVFLADRFGPVWIDGGHVTLDLDDPFRATVSPVTGWGLEEVNREERVALYAVSEQTSFDIERPSVLMFLSERGVGRIAAFPITLPSTARNATYMEVPDEAGVGVPIAAVMIDRVGSSFDRVHDLRVPPYGLVYVDNNDHQNDFVVVPADYSEGWGVLRSHRIWWYASAGATFEVTVTVSTILPAMGPGGDTTLDNLTDTKTPHRLSLVVNQQLLTSGSSDLSGVEATYGLTDAKCEPLGEQDQEGEGTALHTQKQVQTLRVVLTSRVNAIHDICPAVYVDRGELREYHRVVRHPQMWIRSVLPPPQFPVEDA